MIVGLLIYGSYLLPFGSFGAFMSRSMLAPTLLWVGLYTLAVAVIVGLLWYAFGTSQSGRLVAIGIGALGIAFVLWTAWTNCLIPHEYCSAIP